MRLWRTRAGQGADSTKRGSRGVAARAVALAGSLTLSATVIAPAASAQPAPVAQVVSGVTGGVAGVAGGAAKGLDKALEKAAGKGKGLLDKGASWAADTGATPVTVSDVAAATGAKNLWKRGITGEGVGVALIDTGVVPVEGLAGRVVNGPDLSFDSQTDSIAYLDGYGHGTHMAGIIAGRDGGIRRGHEAKTDRFVGMAPGSRLVNMKVGAQDGAVDVSQVIAAIEWVIEHKDDPQLRIRVLNLSFGTDSVQPTDVDPLSHAVELAWKAGIVVVVSGGNSGTELPTLLNPATNPFVLAVGAADLRDVRTPADDVVPAFSQRGDRTRRVDLVAPGQSIISLRDPGSLADDLHPEARVGERFFRGSGTSQAAAVVSGAAALLLDSRPWLTPDMVKAALVRSADPMPAADPTGRGAGLLDVDGAERVWPVLARQRHAASVGTGSIDAARGSSSLVQQGVALDGEIDIFGRSWDAQGWAAGAKARTNWQGGAYRGLTLAGDCFCGDSFAEATWQRASWRDDTWARASWRDEDWARASWRDGQWVRASWRAEDWLRASWRRASWRTDSP